ncbi:RNA-directed DNA polymerase, eukaryota [Tanacetum coccineum]
MTRIASKWGDLMDVDEDELNYHSKRLCVFTKVRQNIQESFKVNFRGKVHWVRAIEVPGWIPEFNDEEEEDDVSDDGRYAPQDAKEKHMLWEYLTHISNSWDGKIVMMGDFNEVRFKSDRFGSNFNVHEAEKFNSFIYNAGMEEVSLGGSAFTLCHRSAFQNGANWSRFFVSENLLTSCPNISAITLERFISDHRPILLRETSFDYGPIPFRFYKYWLEVGIVERMFRVKE